MRPCRARRRISRRREIQSAENQMCRSAVDFGGALAAVAIANPDQATANEILDNYAKKFMWSVAVVFLVGLRR